MKLAPTLLLLVASVAQAAAGESRPVLLDFHADWCGPCKQMRPAVQALVDKGYPVKSIDIDRNAKMAEKYNVEAVPTFIVVDDDGREIDRSSGAQPAGRLARFYLAARAKASGGRDHAEPRDDPRDRLVQGDEGDAEDEAQGSVSLASTRNEEEADADADAEESPTEEELAAKARKAPVNPEPWETVVRIKVYNGGSIGFGSGTIIYSTPEEALILTCAHIFKVDGRKPVSPDKFANKIAIDLFDGRLKGQTLTCVQEGIPGKAVDYDFATDVGLIRFRPGKRLPYSRVVPAHWQPIKNMHMYTVGCSEGHDATAWDTVITRPPSQMLSGNDQHLAIECTHAPKQGRSGGGLYTDNGYVAGVCNFAEPRGDRGLYAAPESIYKLLDRNKLAALYAPPSVGGSGTLLADARGQGRRAETIRGQSPDREERPRKLRQGEVTIPEPAIVGVSLGPIEPAEPGARVQAASGRSGDHRVAWAPPASSRRASPREDVAEPTDLNLDSDADNSHFPPPDFGDDEADDRRVNDEDLSPRSQSRKPAAAAAGEPSGWRAVQRP